MNVGMLWLDADARRPLEEKVERAANHYREKYGQLPELCLVNWHTLSDEKQIGQVEVKPAKNVLRHHFWLGMKT